MNDPIYATLKDKTKEHLTLAHFQGNARHLYLDSLATISQLIMEIITFLFPSRNVIEPLKGKYSDISRPLNESFRHTGHGSVLGNSWGNPTFLDPAYLGDDMAVHLRGKIHLISINTEISSNFLSFFTKSAASSSAKDRKNKCVSEQYVRERKSNAAKQFAYNKLKNERYTGAKHEQSSKKSSTAPKRPPQPKLDLNKKEKEGMLIDLSPPQQQDMDAASSGTFLSSANIMDAPIDVPTEDFGTEEAADVFGSGSDNKPEPPPYQSPPTYMNTAYQMTQTVANYSANSSSEPNQYGNLDPFDTSHVMSPKKRLSNYNSIPSAHRYSADALKVDNSNFIRNQIQPTTSGSNASKTNGASLRPYQSTAVSQLDEMIQNKIASLSPKGSHTSLTEHGSKSSSPSLIQSNLTMNTETQLSYSSENVYSNANAHEDKLSDSLRVNLSSMTLNDTGDNIDAQPNVTAAAAPVSSENAIAGTLDRAFLAELEKEIYKNDISVSNLNVNTPQSSNYSSMNAKDSTVSTIKSDVYGQSSVNWLQNDTGTATPSSSSSASTNAYQSIGTTPSQTQSPAKYTNESIKMTNFESATNMTMNKKLYNTDVGATASSISPKPIVNQIASNHMTAATNNSNQPIYNNHVTANALANSYGFDQTHNFVAVSNRPMSANVQSHSNLLRANNPSNNIYNSVTSEIYGSVAGENVYDIVATPHSANASIYYGMTNVSRNDDYYQDIQNNDPHPQTVIYDEVADDDLLLKPHRRAPTVPPVLSAQQIQRRLERAQKEQQQQVYGNLESSNLYANNGFVGGHSNHSKYEEVGQSYQQKINSLMKEQEATEEEAKAALHASNWDHNQAVRNFKTARLLR